MTSPTLQYSTPRCFYSKTIHRGGAPAAGAAAIFLAVGLVLALFAYRARNPLQLIAFGSAAALFLIGAWMLARDWLTNPAETVRFTDEGIETGGRLWSWHDISRIRATPSGRYVIPEFVTQPAGILDSARVCELPIALSPAEFAELLDRIRPHLAKHHPRVMIQPDVMQR